MKAFMDNRRKLCEEDFQAKLPLAKVFIKKCFRKTDYWNSCYGLKQPMTARLGYFFQLDMAAYMRICGFEVMMDKECRWFVKANYKKNLKLPPVNWEAVNKSWREHKTLAFH